MINVDFVIVGTAMGLTGSASYIRDTLRGVTHPNRVSWLLWGAAPMLAFAVEVRSLRALPAGASDGGTTQPAPEAS